MNFKQNSPLRSSTSLTPKPFVRKPKGPRTNQIPKYPRKNQYYHIIFICKIFKQIIVHLLRSPTAIQYKALPLQLKSFGPTKSQRKHRYCHFICRVFKQRIAHHIQPPIVQPKALRPKPKVPRSNQIPTITP